MNVKLLSITQNPEQHIEFCGRVAYQSFDKIKEGSTERFIKMLVKNQHFSVFEHASATFLISDVSRACSHQLIRHRLASYTQKSQRYVNEESFSYVIPESIKNDGRALEIYLHSMELLDQYYKYLYELKIPKEDCRFLLPNACTTELVMTANFREWRYVVQLRSEKAAQWEIRELVNKILEILKEQAPSCFGDL